MASNKCRSGRCAIGADICDIAGPRKAIGITAGAFVEQFAREHPVEWAAAQKRSGGENIEIVVLGKGPR